MPMKEMPPGGYTNTKCPVCGKSHSENKSWINCHAYGALVCMIHCYECCYQQVDHCRYPRVIHPERKKSQKSDKFIIRNYITFIDAVILCMDMEKEGIVRSFDCPNCLGQAQAVKSEYSGHILAYCNNCGFKYLEKKL